MKLSKPIRATQPGLRTLAGVGDEIAFHRRIDRAGGEVGDRVGGLVVDVGHFVQGGRRESDHPNHAFVGRNLELALEFVLAVGEVPQGHGARNPSTSSTLPVSLVTTSAASTS